MVMEPHMTMPSSHGCHNLYLKRVLGNTRGRRDCLHVFNIFFSLPLSQRRSQREHILLRTRVRSVYVGLIGRLYNPKRVFVW